MLDKVTVRERGPTPRKMRKVHNQAAKAAWVETGKTFHAEMRDDRFSVAHGKKAGYKPRKGEESGLDRRAFFRSYTGRKLRRFHHRRPLEFSGETRRLVRMATISSTSKGGRVAYPGARKFNFRNPHSDINMAEEFRRLLPEETATLAGTFDAALDRNLNKDHTTETKVL